MYNSRIKLTPVPFALALMLGCNANGVNGVSAPISVHYGKVQVKAGASSSDIAIQDASVKVHELQIRSTAGQFLTFTEQEYTLSFSALGQGLVNVLGRAQVPDGDYDQLRLITDDNGSVTLTDGSTHDLFFPSGAESGVKVMLDAPVTIRNGDITSLQVDFDLSHSFVAQGNGRFLFKPVIHVDATVIADPNPSGSDEPVSTVGGGSGSASGGSTTGTSGTTSGGTTAPSGSTSSTSTVSFPTIGV